MTGAKEPEVATEEEAPATVWQATDVALARDETAVVPERPPRPYRVARFIPLAVFVVATFALMPRALLGQATYAAVDLVETTSPYRDAIGRLPFVASPIQTDQAEYLPALVRFWDQLGEGRFQLWEPRFGAGNPLGTLPLMSLLSPASLALLVTPAWYGVTLRAAILLLMSQGFTYLLVRRLGVTRSIAILAGVAYAFSGASLVFVHRMNAVFLLPALLWATHRLMERPKLARAAVVAAFIAWTWFEGFPAAFLFSVYTASAWAVWLIWRHVARARDGTGSAQVREVLQRVAWFAVAGVWGAALSLVNLLPFVTYVQANGLLEPRTYDSGFHLPNAQLFGLFDLSVVGPLRTGPWWTGYNPVESVTHVGMAVMLVVLGGLAAAAFGRLRLAPQGRDAWPFFAGVSLLLVIITFVGTGVLGVVYRLPTLQNNVLWRSRYILAFSLVVLAALSADAWLRRRRAQEAGERAPRAVTIVVGVGLVVLSVTAIDDLLRLADAAGRSWDVVRSVVWGLLLAAAILGVVALARWRPRFVVPATLVAAGLLWVQLAWPLRNFTPEAPKEDFYTVQAGHEVLRDLAGDEYRFAASGFEIYPNSAQLFGAYDLRGLSLRSDELKALIQAANPTAFDRDPLKILLTPEEWNLASPVYDELGVRYFALGTSAVPYGRVVPVDEVWTAWDPLPPDAAWELTFPEAPSGVEIPLAAREAACERTAVTVTLSQGGRELDRASRPAYDAPGNFLSFALTGQELDTSEPATLAVTVDDPGCAMDIGLLGEGDEQRPGLRLIVEDTTQGVRLAATEQAWIYERPGARPLVRVDDAWRAYDSQALLLADLADGTLGDDTGPGVVGEVPAPDPGSAPPEIVSSTLGDDVVRVEVDAPGRALVTVAQASVDGWSVEVDGEPATMVAVDGALQGVIVEPGQHEVAFRFAPRAFTVARLVSGLALVALVATGIWALIERRRVSRAARPAS